MWDEGFDLQQEERDLADRKRAEWLRKNILSLARSVGTDVEMGEAEEFEETEDCLIVPVILYIRKEDLP